MAGVPYTSDYRYDGMGNRTQISRVSASGSSATTSTPNAFNQLTSVTTNITNGPTVTSNLYYDTAGNLTTTVNSDGSGRTTYGYDDADRLTRIERRGNAGQLVTVSEFGYDYASRRAFTREYDFANPSGGWANPVITRDVFNGLDVVQERNSSNQVTAQLVRDGNIGGILSRTTALGAAFYGYDGNGNVTLLTNSTGQDVGHYRYDAFGNTLEAVGARAGENPYRFSTKELHGPSGLYDYGFRFYSPGMGRWMNRDPLREGGGINLYAMVGNNPINDVDAYGLAPKKDNRPCMNDGIPNSCGTDNLEPKVGGPAKLDPGVGGTPNNWSIRGGIITISGGIGADRAKVGRAINLIASTKRGRQMLTRLRGDGKSVTINLNSIGDQSSLRGAYTLNIDPNDSVRLKTTKGMQRTPLDVIIAHELGHAIVGNRDDSSDTDVSDKMANVRNVENSYRSQRRVQLRKIGKSMDIINLYAERIEY